MGYSTDFNGSFKLNKALTAEQAEFLQKFAATRRMAHNVATLMQKFRGELGLPYVKKIIPITTAQDKKIKSLEANGFTVTPPAIKNETVRTAVEIYGQNGEFYVGDEDIAVGDYNTPPKGQPGLWCQWIIENGELKWDGGEKFYNYVEWLQYLIKNFFAPWGVILNGEDRNDVGMIVVTDNKVTTKVGEIVYH